MSQTILSIVIGTYNRLEVLKQCLDSLIGKIKTAHEIIVVDAGSADGTREYVGKLQGARLVCDEGLIGQAQSLNRVFKTLDSKYVCWLSDDNIAQPGILDLAASILEGDHKIGMISLKVKDISGRYVTAEYLGGIWPTGVLNCNQGMLPVALLRKMGGFDERFRDYGIDSDLTTRVLLEGYKVVFTKPVAIHHLRDHDAASWTDSSGRKQKMEKAKELYRQKFRSLISANNGSSYDKAERENSLPLKFVLQLYGGARKMGIPIQEWTGLSERDWRNLLMARFISKADFLINSRKPYYLVQRISGSFLKELSATSSGKNQL